tara:strand:+ start:171 stop:488 length:318 start_codon:yes stop_codon:yes gene_type:complete
MLGPEAPHDRLDAELRLSEVKDTDGRVHVGDIPRSKLLQSLHATGGLTRSNVLQHSHADGVAALPLEWLFSHGARQSRAYRPVDGYTVVRAVVAQFEMPVDSCLA